MGSMGFTSFRLDRDSLFQTTKKPHGIGPCMLDRIRIRQGFVGSERRGIKGLNRIRFHVFRQYMHCNVHHRSLATFAQEVQNQAKRREFRVASGQDKSNLHAALSFGRSQTIMGCNAATASSLKVKGSRPPTRGIEAASNPPCPARDRSPPTGLWAKRTALHAAPSA